MRSFHLKLHQSIFSHQMLADIHSIEILWPYYIVVSKKKKKKKLGATSSSHCGHVSDHLLIFTALQLCFGFHQLLRIISGSLAPRYLTLFTSQLLPTLDFSELVYWIQLTAVARKWVNESGETEHTIHVLQLNQNSELKEAKKEKKKKKSTAELQS